jgi:putative ABC transport system permease protein
MTVFTHLRHAFRSLAQTPLVTAIAVLILTLTVAATSVVFTVVDAVLLQPLPYQDPQQLVSLWENNLAKGNPRNVVSVPNFRDWQQRNRSFSGMAAFYTGPAILTGEVEPQRLYVAAATADLFSVLGRDPQIGRWFSPGEEGVVVLGHGLWQRLFASSPEALGKSITIDGAPMTVVGVAPEDFRYPEDAELWMPFVLSAQPEERSRHYLEVIARLRPGVSLQRARSDLDGISTALAEDFPDSNKGWGVTVLPLTEQLTGAARPALVAMMAAAATVLLIGCANLAMLLVARATARRTEIAVRSALGANPRQIVRQLLGESLLLALIGGGLGLLLTPPAVRALVALEPGDLPRLWEVAVDFKVVLFGFAVSAVAGLAFGLLPALHAVREDLTSGLREGGRGGSGGGGRLRSSLVVVQVALALVLLIGAGLLLQTVWTLSTLDPGFRRDHLLTAVVSLPRTAYPEGHQQQAFFDRLLERVERLPGVESAAAVSDLPVLGIPRFMLNSFYIVGAPPLPPGEKIKAYLRWVSPGYFQTVGIPLLRGRDVLPSDVEGTSRVVVVDQAFVDRYFPGENAIGQRLEVRAADDPICEIVGVVGSVRPTALDEEPQPHMYLSYRQTPVYYMTLVLRTAGDPMQVAGLLRRDVHAIDPELPIIQLETMATHLADSTARRRFAMTALLLFAGIALLLAAAGIYAVTAYRVALQARELGIRLALGAPRGGVIAMVVKHSLLLAGAGVLLGMLGALGATRFIAGLLFGVGSLDPWTFIVLAVFLIAVAGLASYLPARQAATVDLVEILQEG